jgi:hypothetical protein
VIDDTVTTAPNDPEHVQQLLNHIAHLEDEQIGQLWAGLSGWVHLQQVRDRARRVVEQAVDELERELHAAGVQDLVVQSLAESYIDVAGFKRSIESLTSGDIDTPEQRAAARRTG